MLPQNSIAYLNNLFHIFTFFFFFIVAISSQEVEQQVWPPSDPESLIDKNDGLIDLAIKPRVVQPPRNGQQADHHELLMKSLASETVYNKNHSQLKRMVDLQLSLLQQPDRPQYNFYPQMLDMRVVVEAVQYGQPVDEEPMNDPPLKPVILPKSACQTKDSHWPNLVIIVESCVECAKARKHARETYMNPALWSEFSVEFVFVITLSNVSVTKIDLTQLNTTFPELYAESMDYGDLLIGGPVEPTLLKTWTHILAFRWATIFCQDRVPLFLFLSSNFTVVPQNLIAFLRGIPRDLQLILNAGLRPSTLSVPRVNHPDPVSPEEIPWNNYPEHYNDTAFFVGAELLQQASIAMAFTRPFRNSAAYLGFVWAKLDYPSLHLPKVIREYGNWAELYAASVTGMRDLDNYMDWANGYFFDPK